MSEAQQNTGNVDVAVGVVQGKVVAKWHQPTNQIVFDPQNAFEVGEALARAGHEARFGTKPAADASYIAEQVRARVTEELRDHMVARVALVLPQLMERKWTPGRTALEVVDICLAMAQGRVV